MLSNKNQQKNNKKNYRDLLQFSIQKDYALLQKGQDKHRLCNNSQLILIVNLLQNLLHVPISYTLRILNVDHNSSDKEFMTSDIFPSNFTVIKICFDAICEIYQTKNIQHISVCGRVV